MESKVLLQPAYVLHKQPFQNTSQLVDFFCLDYGRVRAVAKGARTSKSKYRSLLQLFHPILVSMSGRGEVKTVTAVDCGVNAISLVGQRLFSGLYINELITRLLHFHVDCPAIYRAYQQTLIELQGNADLNVVLRRFELLILSQLGYGLDLSHDCNNQADISPDGRYLFVAQTGFERIGEAGADLSNSRVFSGEHLMELAQLKFSSKASINSAKRVMRLALQAHLGDKPLHSRDLFTQPTQ
ncbi:MAG: DNA repair protein RecO [SAR86 cluster bacterium]|uniref:DNA repair protein RecO n=1 Tax=SAR86 cluster bacterium TaxID=2030880 RepID=A0A2A4MIA6_9GAMM|nr:MAG: DNA repair protein RecO [SAR86 cluster bacterium]